MEFWDEKHIFSRYGERGITEYKLDTKGVARFSDDTQMTLFTANGLLLGTTRGVTRGIMGPYESYVGVFATETGTARRPRGIRSTKGGVTSTTTHGSSACLSSSSSARRGNTCLSACAEGCEGTTECPVNSRQGLWAA